MANTEPWVGTWRPHRPRRPIAAMHQTPGPNKYLLPSLTGTSKHDPTKSKSPAFSMASRHLQSTVHHSPGPAHFVEPNTTRTAGPGPVFHFTGPADYNVRPVPKPVNPKSSSTFGHRPTAGSFYENTGQSPGPAAYGAVKLDKWKRKAPECTMAGRPSAQQQNVTTPGPAAHRPGKAPSFSFGVHHSQYKAPLILNDDY
uniref:Uncharacterized protein n=1 Tax=Salarias fasciatus TaxID=181472 RepID=A0A672J5V9_SALFA